MLEALAAQWMAFKLREEDAVNERRAIEDKIVALLTVPASLEGTETSMQGEFVIKITGRIDRKVDSDKLQDIAIEHGLTEHLATLFRWKPEISMTAWKAADESITRPLLEAITSKPGRPSFKITIKE